MKKLWKILVSVTNDGKKIKKKYHRKWNHKVSEIAGGLTLFKAKKGCWKHGGKMFSEKMIRVEIAATQDQKVVMHYLKSEQVVITEY